MYRLSNIAKIINATVDAESSDAVISILLTDSRKLTDAKHSLFFALDGPVRNGHLFIPELYKAGLRQFVVSRTPDKKRFPTAIFLKVDNVLSALQKLARYHRNQFNYDVIGITGSNGKTIVKEWIFQLLEASYNIVRSPKSYNSQIGVSLSVWQMSSQNNLAIFEAGISQPKEMNRLADIIDPTIGVLTHIGSAHNEGFNNALAKLREKIKLFQHAKIVISNGDDILIRREVEKCHPKAFFWGKNQTNILRICHIKKQKTCTSIKLYYQDQNVEVKIPFIDDASIENAICACATALCVGLSIKDMQSRTTHLQSVNMRLAFNAGINNCIIINDSYSADTDSLAIALDFLKQQGKRLKKTVILSDFLQSGKNLKRIYEDIISQLQQHKITRLIGVGTEMQNIVPKIITEKKIKFDFASYPNTDAFLQHLHSFEFKEEAILIKGARVFAFEKIATQLEQRAHHTVLEINLNAIAHNFQTFQHRLHSSTKIMVMVKAFAYGSGGAEIASLLQYHKADYLGVAYADEGVELRKAGITLPIMVLNPEESAFELITDYNLEPDIFSSRILELFERHLLQSGLKQYPIHIEIETGMNRLGFNVEDLGELGDRLKNNQLVKVKSVFSHLAASEDKAEDKFTLYQYNLILIASDKLHQILGYPFIRHIANTSAIARLPKIQLEMVRLGIGLYGIAGKQMSKKLVPALTLKSTIAQIKCIKKGETVSYNRLGIAEKDTVIATVRIGYADGYSRKFGNGNGYMIVKNKKAAVIGSVCMDMVMINITQIKNVQEGDEVIVFGSVLPIQSLAKMIDTIPYEIMTSISQRVKRVYWSE